MRQPTLEGFGRKLAVKFGVMVTACFVVASYSTRPAPTENLETHLPARPGKAPVAQVAPAP